MEEVDHLASPCNSMIPLHLPLDCEIKHIPVKRGFDILFSICCLSLGAPVYLIIALIIFLTSPGKVIYAQERIGRGGKPFRCYKFRSMYANADQRLHSLLAADPRLKEEWEKNYKLKKDPRINPFGAFLRKTSLDEIPQFWNVLKGDLSVVGPRPVVKDEISKYYQIKAYKILSVRPGLTGIWQVSGRSNIQSYETRIQMDEFYVDHHSFFLDIKLIAKTIPAMLFSKGAY